MRLCLWMTAKTLRFMKEDQVSQEQHQILNKAKKKKT